MPAGLGEGQIAKLIEDQEVEATQEVSGSSLAVGARFGVKLVDEVDNIEEALEGREINDWKMTAYRGGAVVKTSETTSC